MGISLSPSTWIFNLSKNNKDQDSQIAEYLDNIAEEAVGVAKIWENITSSILATGVAEAENDIVWIRLVERPEWTIYSKNIPRSRLEIFYEKVSNVLGKSPKDDMDFLICKIGGILQKRKLTREIIEEELKRVKDVKFFDKNSRIKDELSIADSVSLLNREAAALYAFAKDYKVKI
jgi:hypothetical protein